jgi:hypothetical protein
VNSANSRFTERPARGLTKLIGMASSTRIAADTGMPTRHSASPRFTGVGLASSCAVVMLLCESCGSLLSAVSMRAA